MSWLLSSVRNFASRLNDRWIALLFRHVDNRSEARTHHQSLRAVSCAALGCFPIRKVHMSEFKALLPKDEHNLRMEAAVHPPDWVNPTPDGRYNLVVIGGGAAGLVSSAGAAGLGAKVAIVERELLGGDCLTVGCVPSKGMISAARALANVRDAKQFGVKVPDGVEFDFAEAMQRMRRLRADIAPNDSAARFRDLGVDVFLGNASFSGPDTVEVNGTQLQFRKAVIATGGRAKAPSIPGLEDVDYLTNETVFSLTELPQRLGIIGSGVVGCELGQTFARMGSQVVMVGSKRGVLPKEDPDASEIIRKALIADGVTLFDSGREMSVSQDGEGIRLRIPNGDAVIEETVDQLLVSVGRAPNVEGLNLEAVGVDYDTTDGVFVTDRLQTTNPRIFACGDICSSVKFTHAADFMARRVLQNALFFGRAKFSDLVIPWCIYTSPEVARVGLTAQQAAEAGIPIDTYTQPFADVDRAILEGDTEGFVRVHVKQGTDSMVGATIVARNAGDMIGEVTLAMRNGIGLGRIADTIHPYPTQGEAVRKVGDLFNRTRLTPFRKKLLKRVMEWMR